MFMLLIFLSCDAKFICVDNKEVYIKKDLVHTATSFDYTFKGSKTPMNGCVLFLSNGNRIYAANTCESILK